MTAAPAGGLPATMQAVRVHAPGGPEALRVDTVPVPGPDAGEAESRDSGEEDAG